MQTDTSGSICIQVVFLDPKIHKLTTRSTCMDGGYISNKLDKPKSICLPSICCDRDEVAKAMREKCTVNITTPFWASQPRYMQFMRTCVRPNFSPPFPNPLKDLNQNQHPLYLHHTLASAVWKVPATVFCRPNYWVTWN